jgi:hypothetical protein
LKWLLLIALFGLAFGGGGRRLLGLFTTFKQLPDAYKNGQRANDDPSIVAKEVRGRVD